MFSASEFISGFASVSAIDLPAKDNHREGLNEISHNAAIHLIRVALKRGVRVAEVYVDTVGPPEKYQAKLQALFPAIKVGEVSIECLNDISQHFSALDSAGK